MRALCKNVYFTPSESALTNGHCRSETPHRNSNGLYVNPRGSGWALETKPAEVTVIYCTEEGVKGAYHFGWLIRQMWGKVTEKKARLLQSTMPAKIMVEKCESVAGTVYYVPSEADLSAWINRAIALGGGC